MNSEVPNSLKVLGVPMIGKRLFCNPLGDQNSVSWLLEELGDQASSWRDLNNPWWTLELDNEIFVSRRIQVVFRSKTGEVFRGVSWPIMRDLEVGNIQTRDVLSAILIDIENATLKFEGERLALWESGSPERNLKRNKDLAIELEKKKTHIDLETQKNEALLREIKFEKNQIFLAERIPEKWEKLSLAKANLVAEVNKFNSIRHTWIDQYHLQIMENARAAEAHQNKVRDLRILEFQHNEQVADLELRNFEYEEQVADLELRKEEFRANTDLVKWQDILQKREEALFLSNHYLAELRGQIDGAYPFIIQQLRDFIQDNENRIKAEHFKYLREKKALDESQILRSPDCDQCGVPFSSCPCE